MFTDPSSIFQHIRACLGQNQQSNEEGKDQESIQSNTLSDPGHRMEK